MKINFIGFLVIIIGIIALLGTGINGFKLQNFNFNSNKQNQMPTTIIPLGPTPIVTQNIPAPINISSIEIHKEEISPPINDSPNILPSNDKADANSDTSKKKHSAIKLINKYGKQACDEYCSNMGLKGSTSSLNSSSKGKKKKNATLFGVICVCEGGNNTNQSQIENKEEPTTESNQPASPEPPKKEEVKTNQSVQQEIPKKEGEQKIINATDSKSISSSIAQPQIAPPKN